MAGEARRKGGRKRLSRWGYRLGGRLAALAVRGWMGTLDYRAAYYDLAADPAGAAFRGPAIFLLWHEYLLFPLYLRGGCNIAMLVSRHQDAELLSQAARWMGFATIRGSTRRGGVAALREALRAGQGTNLAITPDGPRGPRRRLAPGCVYLASRLQIPLVALGLGYDRPWRVPRAWDRFAVPRPFSRARAVVSPPLWVAGDAGRAELERTRWRIERLMQELTELAEQWAADGRPRGGETPLRPAAPGLLRRAA